ncbi:MAG: flagellar filament capping protein FliD [Lachnospiraceae bacterium]|nr:flagellar filament capping protein FliD [Lachnospiraceae bacterium]
MAIGLSGMISGLDTDSIVKAMMSGQTAKKTKLENKITMNKWTTSAWSDLNKKIYSFYTDFASKLRLQSTFLTNKASSSNENAVTATATNVAAAGSHTVEVQKLASSQYVTGAKLAGGAHTQSTKLGAIDPTLVGQTITFKTGSGDNEKTQELKVDAKTTIGDFLQAAKDAGITASFDVTHQRFFLSSAESGTENAFTVTSVGASDEYRAAAQAFASYIDTSTLDEEGLARYNEKLNAITTAELDDVNAVLADDFSYEEATDAQKAVYDAMNELVEMKGEGASLDELKTLTDNFLNFSGEASAPASLASLGLGEHGITGEAISENGVGSLVVVAAEDATAVVDGATITSSSNKLSVNGLTLDLQKTTQKEDDTFDTVTVTVNKDTTKAYDFLKSAIKSYNELLTEMDKLYNAKSARDYKPLTSEQKEEMTDDEVEQWETRIKDSLLRNDSTLSGIISGMRTSLQASFTTKSGKEYSLASFGIVTGNYTERGKLHIYGDTEDALFSTFDDRIQKMLAEDPDEVAEALGGIFTNLYTTLTDKCAKTSVSSALTFYNDKQYTTTLNEHEKKLKEMETKISKLEERYYKQFTAMEKAMSKLQSQTSSLTSLFGAPTQ